MILALKSAGESTEIILADTDGTELSRSSWQSGRSLGEELLSKLQEELARAGGDLYSLTGLIVFRGPGSFTSLRIAITTVNTLAYALGISNAGAEGDDWVISGLNQLKSQTKPQIITPLYDRGPNITKPVK